MVIAGITFLLKCLLVIFIKSHLFVFLLFQCSWDDIDLGVSSLDDSVLSVFNENRKEKEDIISSDDFSVSMVNCETPNKNIVVIFKNVLVGQSMFIIIKCIYFFRMCLTHPPCL